MNGNRGMGWLARREVLRVSKLWTQTILASVVSSFLFILVFGLSLGGRIKQVDGFDYEIFIVPGLIAMAMVQAAYANNASTIYQGRSDRFINDVLSAPMHPWQMTLGYVVGGIYRGFAIALALLALALPITGVPVEQPLVLVVAVFLALLGFASLGTVVGIYAESWDHTTFIQNIVILPLTFVGGVFYSVDMLASPWEELSHFNPIFYMLQAIRYGFLGASDVSIWLSLGVTAALAIPCSLWAQWLFTTGRKRKAWPSSSGGSSTAAAARGSSSGASRSRARSARRSATRSTGDARLPASAIRRPASTCSAWRRPPMEPIAQAGCSPATAPATGCSPRCTAPATPTSRPRPTSATACGWPAPSSPRRSAARRRPTSRYRASATTACPTRRESSICSPSARSSPSAASRGTPRCASPDLSGPSRSSATAPRPSCPEAAR